MTIDPAAVVLGLTAFGVSLLTLFSGFGLGTLLMPVFALFFPVEVAVASTAVVHAANNLWHALIVIGPFCRVACTLSPLIAPALPRRVTHFVNYTQCATRT